MVMRMHENLPGCRVLSYCVMTHPVQSKFLSAVSVRHWGPGTLSGAINLQYNKLNEMYWTGRPFPSRGGGGRIFAKFQNSLKQPLAATRSHTAFPC